RDRLALSDEGAYAIPVLAGNLGVPDELDRDDIEGRPVDPLERYGSVGDPDPETLADRCHGLAEEVVDAGADPGEPLRPAIGIAQQQAEPLTGAVTWHESVVHDAQLDAGDEHDIGPPLPDPLRPLGAVGEQRQDLA